eukprot:12478236-Alexandrium_andersonii.AAC.1
MLADARTKDLPARDQLEAVMTTGRWSFQYDTERQLRREAVRRECKALKGGLSQLPSSSSNLCY